MIMFISICYNTITYKTLIWITLTPNTTLTPGLIFTFIAFNTKHFYYFLRGEYYFKYVMIIRK